jgi:hypothetical protein
MLAEQMNENRWERYGASAGVVFVVALVATLFVAPIPPHIDASTEKIATYYTDHHTAVMTSAWLGVFAAIAFVWFLGHLRHVLQRAEGGAEALSPIVFASGAVLAAVGTISAMPSAILGFMGKNPADLANASTVRALFDGGQIASAMLGMLTALFLAAMSLAMVRKELVAPWLGWVGLVAAAGNMASGIASFYLTTYSSAWAIISMVSLLGFAAVILVASVVMLQRPEATRVTAPRAVFTH